nr:MAG TPA: hypothetical protein [Caudoviricetes sp.]
MEALLWQEHLRRLTISSTTSLASPWVCTSTAALSGSPTLARASS